MLAARYQLSPNGEILEDISAGRPGCTLRLYPKRDTGSSLSVMAEAILCSPMPELLCKPTQSKALRSLGAQ